MDLTNSFSNLLLTFSPVFSGPSFVKFRLLMTGLIISMRHRYITDMIVSSDSVHFGHFADYHRFFSHAVWDIDKLWGRLGNSQEHKFNAKRRPTAACLILYTTA